MYRSLHLDSELPAGLAQVVGNSGSLDPILIPALSPKSANDVGPARRDAFRLGSQCCFFFANRRSTVGGGGRSVGCRIQWGFVRGSHLRLRRRC